MNFFCLSLASYGLAMGLHLIGDYCHRSGVDVIYTAPAVLGGAIIGMFSMIYKFEV